MAEHDASFQLENPPAAHSSALAEFHGAKPKTTPTEFVERYFPPRSAADTVQAMNLFAPCGVL